MMKTSKTLIVVYFILTMIIQSLTMTASFVTKRATLSFPKIGTVHHRRLNQKCPTNGVSIIDRKLTSYKLSQSPIYYAKERSGTTCRWMTTQSEINKENKTLYVPTEDEKSIVQDMLYRIRECNDVPHDVKDNLKDFVVGKEKVGKVTEKVASLLCASTPDGRDAVFKINDSDGSLTLTGAAGDTVEQRSDAVMCVMQNLRSQGVITGWRDELYPLSKGFYDEPLLFVERASAPFLGMQQYGVHINGIVKVNKEEKMWIARRSKTKSKYPGMLDHIVAGGQPAGLSLMENVLKECAEEAGISEDITLDGIHAVGAVSYEQFEASNNDAYDGVISRSLLFNYDLYLPDDFLPKVVDGEVEDFFLWTVDDIMESMKREYEDPIKPNCYLVIIDYLLRKGYLSPEIPGYLDVLRELRGGYCG